MLFLAVRLLLDWIRVGRHQIFRAPDAFWLRDALMGFEEHSSLRVKYRAPVMARGVLVVKVV